MDTKIIDYAKELLGGNFVQSAAGKLGESSEGISKAISAIVPTIFGAIGNKISSDSSFLTTVVSEAKNIFANHSLNDLGSLIKGDSVSPESTQSSSFLYDLFGGGLHNIVEKISSYAGIKTASTRQLFDASGIASLGSLGKSFTENNGTLDSVAAFFKNHTASFLSAVPAGLGLSSLFSGLHSSHTETAHVADTSHDHVDTTKKGGNRFLVPLILALIALFLLIWLFRGCWGNEKAHDGTDSVAETTDTTVAPASAAVRTLTAVVLPNGDTLQAYPGGIEDQLVKFIQSDEYKNADESALKNKWFNFDDLNFKFGTTELDTSSTRQLNNIVAILKAFPAVKMKIGGYTDKKGDSTANFKLSDGRAKTVQAALKTAGVGAQVPEADGYGSQFATVSADASDEERAVDRHTSVRLVK